MLLEHADELEADFQQFYNLSLPALIGGGEFRRAAALASQLPREARTVRTLEPRAAWGPAEYMLALVVDNLAFMRYEQSGGKGRRPKAVERPSARAGRRRAERTVHGMSPERVGAILSAPRA